MRTKECDFESVSWPVYSEEESKRGHKSTSVVEQSCGAGISGRLALHSRSILPCREDQECYHPVSDAASPPQTAVRLWVFAYPARGTTQTSTCAGPGVVKTRENYRGKSKGCKILGERGSMKPHATSDSETSARWKRVDGHDSSRCHHSHPGSRQQLRTQVSLSPRSQRLDNLQLPQSPVLADVVAQLQVLMASVQSIATTVGQLGGQLHSLQTGVTVMKNADNEDDEFEEHDGFSSDLEKERRSRPKPLASQNSTLPDLHRTEW